MPPAVTDPVSVNPLGAMHASSWLSFRGQELAKELLQDTARSARMRGATMPHILLHTPMGGMGKSSLAGLTAMELGRDVHISAGNIKPSEARVLLHEMTDGQVWMIEEALALDTQIPTPGGWTTMGDLREGSVVFGSDGQPTNVIRATDIAVGRPCMRVNFADGDSIVADENHLWEAIVHAPQNPPRVLTTKQMADYKSAGRYVQIRRPLPLELPEITLPIDPYIFGLWLGDGDTARPMLAIRNGDVAHVQAELNRSGYEARIMNDPETRGCRRISFSSPAIKSIFRSYGFPDGKYIPDVYLRASREQRLALIQGLMDSDGHVNKVSGYCTFANTNKQIVERISELLRTMGLVPTIANNPTPCNPRYKQGYKVHFSPRDVTVSRLPRLVERLVRGLPKPGSHLLRQISSIEPVESVPVRCIEVDARDHLFLAGKSMIPTHNCHNLFAGGPRNWEWMLTFMSDGLFPGPRGLEEVPQATIIGTTTEIGKIPDTILQRFRIQPTIVPYSDEEATDVALELGYRTGVTPAINVDTAAVIARAAGNHPRTMQGILIIMRDCIEVGRIKATRGSYLTKAGLLPNVVYQRAGVTPDGLTVEAIKYLSELRAAMEPLGQKPLEDAVGLSGEAFKTMEQRLLDRSLIVKTKRGRQLTRDGILRAKEAA